MQVWFTIKPIDATINIELMKTTTVFLFYNLKTASFFSPRTDPGISFKFYDTYNKT